MAIIEANNISKTFGSLQVLKGISASISQGEIVTIVGASGAGKTTFLQIAGTLMNPSGGKIIINGTDVGNLRDKELARFRNKHIGFVFQFHHLLPEFTALENTTKPSDAGDLTGLLAYGDEHQHTHVVPISAHFRARYGCADRKCFAGGNRPPDRWCPSAIGT